MTDHPTPLLQVAQKPSKRACAYCGKDPAAGLASVWSTTTGELWLCHTGEETSCYEQVQQQLSSYLGGDPEAAWPLLSEPPHGQGGTHG